MSPRLGRLLASAGRSLYVTDELPRPINLPEHEEMSSATLQHHALRSFIGADDRSGQFENRPDLVDLFAEWTSETLKSVWYFNTWAVPYLYRNRLTLRTRINFPEGRMRSRVASVFAPQKAAKPKINPMVRRKPPL